MSQGFRKNKERCSLSKIPCNLGCWWLKCMWVQSRNSDHLLFTCPPSESQTLDGPEKCWSKGGWVIRLPRDTPGGSLVWRVSPGASHGHELDKHQNSPSNTTCMAPVAFTCRHLNREVPMVGSMMVTLQVSLVKVFCICTRYTEKKTQMWIGSGGGCCHCSKWKKEVVCRREEITRLKEIVGRKRM